jgi:very-short-patch-repair endonuclease
MKPTFLLLLLVVVLASVGAAVFLARLKSRAVEEPWPFMVRKPMSVPEQVLYFRLLDVLPEHIVLAQVQLSRFLGVKRGNSVRAWLNRINRLSVDFLILKKDATVVAAIELDDKTHERRDRRAADSRKDRALADAGVKLVRWNVADMPSSERIRADLTGPASQLRPTRSGDRIEPVLVAEVPTHPQRQDARTATNKRAPS